MKEASVEGDACEECHKNFEEGDDVTFIEPADASNRPTRMWHTACFEKTLRPLKDLRNSTTSR